MSESSEFESSVADAMPFQSSTTESTTDSRRRLLARRTTPTPKKSSSSSCSMTVASDKKHGASGTMRGKSKPKEEASISGMGFRRPLDNSPCRECVGKFGKDHFKIKGHVGQHKKKTKITGSEIRDA
jgi:hypothetical protein